MNFYVEMLLKTEVVNVSSSQCYVLGTILNYRIRLNTGGLAFITFCISVYLPATYCRCDILTSQQTVPMFYWRRVLTSSTREYLPSRRRSILETAVKNVCLVRIMCFGSDATVHVIKGSEC